MASHQVTQDRLRSWFFPSSLEAILSRDEWKKSLERPHSTVPGLFSWEREVSRQCLLMNLFCSPSLQDRDDFTGIFNCRSFRPKLFADAPLKKLSGSLDLTSIDVGIDDTFCQASLAEKDFTEQRVEVVEQYHHFGDVFQVSNLLRHNGNFLNFRVIRNLLAAFQYGKGHMLLCDRRRTDLIESYLATVENLTDEKFRPRCRVVFWQDLLQDIDPDLSRFVRKRFRLLD